MEIDFIKCHGSSNDFILIDECEKKYGFTEQNRYALARYLCLREGLIGADGILFFQKSSIRDAKMRMFNPDGTEAEMCGNGVRCVGRYAQEILGKKVVFIETMKGVQKIEREKDLSKSVWTVSVGLKPVSVALSDIPLLVEGETFINRTIDKFSEMRYSAVSMGNPHLISFVEKMDLALLEKVGKKVNQTKSIFPEGMNVSFCKLIEKNKLMVMTYERGLGITKACGTGMSATSLISVILKYCEQDTWIEIYNKGGITKCNVNQLGESFTVELLGNVTYEYMAKITLNWLDMQSSKMVILKTFAKEKEAYSCVIDRTEKYLTFSNLKT